MPASATEIVGSRVLTIGKSPTADLKYKIEGADDEVAAYAAMAAAAPAIYNVDGRNMVRDSIKVDPTEDTTLYFATVHYVAPGSQRKEPASIGETLITFDTSGGTQRIMQSKATVSRTPISGVTAPDYKGAIGVSSSGIEGCDIVVPKFSFTVTKVFAAGSLPSPSTIFALTGTVNSASFTVTDSRTGLTITLNAGECLFLGGRSGGQRGDGGVEFVYQFSAAPNLTNVAVGDITVPAVGGWDHLWVRYYDVTEIGRAHV